MMAGAGNTTHGELIAPLGLPCTLKHEVTKAGWWASAAKPITQQPVKKMMYYYSPALYLQHRLVRQNLQCTVCLKQ